MSEALIWYRRRGGMVDPEDLKPKTITSNTTYEAPVTGTYWIACIGGGGGGGGGCWNAANSSTATTQFYGNAGVRGTLSSTSITLNAGDKITCNMGAGGSAGTNNSTRYAYSNGCNNSRGVNGGTGGTTTFGSYLSGSGGRYGYRAWSWQVWSNTNYGWVNRNLGWSNTITGWTGQQPIWNNQYYSGGYFHTNKGAWGGMDGCGAIMTLQYTSYPREYYRCSQCGVQGWWDGHTGQLWNMAWKQGWSNTITGWTTNSPIWSNYVKWSNYINWVNKKTNYSNNCFSSIQKSTWWYVNTNNQVSTSGTLTYSGGGGNSGRIGNSGFMVIKPPTI